MNDTPEFYILNTMDKPCARHVCQRTEAGLEYIHPDLRNYPNMDCREESTKIENFGFDVTIEDGLAQFEKVRQSTAKYSDGSHRQWQGAHAFTLFLK